MRARPDPRRGPADRSPAARAPAADLLALAAVVVLAFENLLLAVLTAVLPETSGPVTTWVSPRAGVLGAGLLAGAALAPERRLRDPGRALVLTAAGCVAVLALCVAVAALADLPPAFSEQPETAAELQRLSQSPGLIVAALVTAALFLAAGIAFARRSDPGGRRLPAVARRGRDRRRHRLRQLRAVAVGVHGLRLRRRPLPRGGRDRLGRGHEILAVIGRYQEAYAGAEVLEERRRVARDAHDGIAQELALISTQMHTLPPEGEAAVQIRAAVERALDETRGAIFGAGPAGRRAVPRDARTHRGGGRGGLRCGRRHRDRPGGGRARPVARGAAADRARGRRGGRATRRRAPRVGRAVRGRRRAAAHLRRRGRGAAAAGAA